MKIYGHSSAEATDNTFIMPAYAHDYANYVARFGMGNFQIQVVMKLDGKLDFDKLSKAVRLSVDAEPVLGCKFVENDPPYWKRIEDIDNTVFCTMEEYESSEEAEKAADEFLQSPLDMDLDPLVKLRLIRSDRQDMIIIKMNHACSDGSGVKDYVELLSHIYNCINSDKGEYVPIPGKRSREDHWKAFRTLGIKYPELDMSVVEHPRTVWPFPWNKGCYKYTTPFVIRRLPRGQVSVLSKYAKQRNATINDLIITAMYRTLFRLIKPPYGIPMDIGLTVDLRRYLPEKKAEAIRNFSGGIVLSLPRMPGETFEKTLSRVVSLMKYKKSKNPGHECATGAEKAEKLKFSMFLSFAKFVSKISEIASQYCFFCSPGLSNVGIISGELIKFGDITVTEAYFLPPVVRPPCLLFVASSYNDILTLACGYYEDSVRREYLEMILDGIKNELMVCK